MKDKLLDCTIENDNRNIFTAKEQGKVYSYYNNSKRNIAKIKVEDCVFFDNVKKCDWLFQVENILSIFVELKGSDIRKGQKQLLITYEALKVYINNEIWFRLCIGKHNSVPKSIKQDKVYRNLFEISKGNIKIEKNIIDIN